MAIARSRPTLNADSSAVVTPSRTGSYTEAYVIPVGTPFHTLCDEGSYYSVSNATNDTQITAHAAPAVADVDTKPVIHIFNGGTSRIYLDYISIYSIVANASATRVFFDAYTDAKGSTSRTGGGSASGTIANTNSGSTNTSGATVFAGAVTAVHTSPRKIFHSMVRPAIGIALDQYHFSFGSGLGMSQGAFVQATVQSTFTAGPPIVIAPGGNFAFVQISPSGAATAMTFEYQVGYWER